MLKDRGILENEEKEIEPIFTEPWEFWNISTLDIVQKSLWMPSHFDIRFANVFLF